MTSNPDIIVIGLGAIGSVVTRELAQRGAIVVGIDRFDPPHALGSSHGWTRITRLAAGEGAAYVPLVQRSHTLWRELEAQTGRSLYRATGALVIGSEESDANEYHGQSGFFSRTRALARQFDIAHETLAAPMVSERFPAFRLQDFESAYFEPEGGVLFPEVCIAAQLQVAVRHGASIRTGERLLDLKPGAGGVVVKTDRATFTAGHVVLCIGAWLPAFVGDPLTQRLRTPLRVLRQALHWFETDRADLYHPDRCPVYIWLHGTDARDAFYGFPMVDHLPGAKVATEQFEQTTEPDAVDRVVTRSEVEAMFSRHVYGRLLGMQARTVHDATCLYTTAPGGRFLVDAHPQLEHVTMVSPCSGHGFKHSAALGESIAQRLLGQTPRVCLNPFSLESIASGY